MNIKVENLTKKYKDVIAVNDISFEIKANELVSLLGVNGAGKTTTLKILSGLISKDNGKVFFDSFDLDNDYENIKKISNISPQETAVAENLTTKENIEFIASVYGLGKEESKKKTSELLSTFGLIEVANKRAHLLSGGMQRRLSIAMALVSNPQILYLDEPTLGLDVLARQELWNIIEELKSKITIILTTHYMEEAESLSDRVIIMNKGKILDSDTPKGFMQKTKTKSLEKAFIKIIKGAKE